MEAGEPLAESLARDRRRPLKPDAGNAAVGSKELDLSAMRFRAWLFVLNPILVTSSRLICRATASVALRRWQAEHPPYNL